MLVPLLSISACEGDSVVASGPDTIVINATVYPDASSGSVAEGFAITESKISAIGDVATISALATEDTAVVDLGGATVFPGLLDAHSHPVWGGRKLLYECNFPFSATPEELAKTIGECSADDSAPEWIVGGQWDSNFFVDNDISSPREFLDAVSHGHPVVLSDDSGHHSWANTKALQLSGIAGADAEDPEGGEIVRDAAGVPNGILLEYASKLVESNIPPYSHEQTVAAIAAVSEIANRFGLTAFAEARTDVPELDAYADADQKGLLTVRALLYQQSFSLEVPAGSELPVSDYIARAEEYQSPNIDARAIKFFLDGVPTASRTAMMIEAYTTDANHSNGGHGTQMIPTDSLFDSVSAFDAADFRIKIHTAGDGSVRLALDAIEGARKANGPGHAVTLAHAGYVSDADIPRFKSLGAAADFSPYLWYPRPIINSVIQAVGEPRGSKYWPTKDLLAAGATLVAGSDWPSAAIDINPWPAIESLVTRKHYNNASDETFWAEQAISLDDALTLWTSEAAEVMGLSAVAGSLAVGKSADFIVLPIDPHRSDIEAVSDIVPEQTWFRGERVTSAQD
ncbi:amidohydrolase 3 [Luminiphilus syltensis NOR5-1B]|uniref:Amidohydrolase 3 n=2 Tax=Luminiphilus TaxID=1341118 RepID=B8KT64_9GAMM|nr:amidohydrolase 3 [Luminiphilus syltensis NOR5-1B]